MKCIGVNQWAGASPDFGAILADLERQAAQARRLESERWTRMTPSTKFLKMADECFQAPLLYGIAPAKGFWQVGKSTLVEMHPICLDDVPDSAHFLIHLQSLYVVDAARGTGEGTKTVEELKRISDETGCGMTLFAKSFAFSRDGSLPYAMQSIEDLRRASLEEQWPVIYLPEWDVECLRFFYEGRGFRNMCLYDSRVYSRPKEDDLPFERQFVYLPSSMGKAWRSQIEHRLNRDLCEFCNR
jgi:hypothetical protein